MRVLSAMLFSSALAFAALPSWAATLTVTGEGVVQTVPDMALVSLGVITQGETAAEAMAANADGLAAVLDRLRALGIADKDVQTSTLQLNPNWTNNASGDAPMISGYTASNMVTLRVQEIAGLGALLDATVADGANTLNGVSFALSQSGPLQDQARAAAVADAKARAEVLATAAGVTLGAIETITEGGASYGGGPMFKTMAAEATPIAAGQVEVSASVTITYQIAE